MNALISGTFTYVGVVQNSVSIDFLFAEMASGQW